LKIEIISKTGVDKQSIPRSKQIWRGKLKQNYVLKTEDKNVTQKKNPISPPES